jgi:hypothetical protein
VKIEPDGAMLATGVFAIEHKSPLGFVFDTPQDMKLLSCELGGRPVSPVDLGGGTLKVTLPPQGGSSRLACSFSHTGTMDKKKLRNLRADGHSPAPRRSPSSPRPCAAARRTLSSEDGRKSELRWLRSAQEVPAP